MLNYIQYINVTIEIICIIICLILLLGVVTAEYQKEKLNKFFICLISFTLPLLFVDILICLLVGHTGAYINIIFRTAYFLSFVLGTILLILFTYYLLAFIDLKTTVTKRTKYVSGVAISICIVNMVFIILTQCTGLYYYIDENNIVYYGDFYILSQVSAIICILLNTRIMLAYRKYYKKREMVFLLSYVVLPMLAILINYKIDGFLLLIDLAITLTLLMFYAGIQSEMAKRLKQKELELIENRIDIMLSQIQPHFLYNVLGAIDKLYFENTEEGHNALIKFSNYLRGNMDSLAKKKRIPFAEELAHVKQYLWLEELRFGNKLRVIYDIRTDAFTLPVLTLQPITENAVRYGATKKQGGGSVTLKTEETERSYIIEVIDDGVGFNPDEPHKDGRSHIGIDNVRGRLHSMCDGTLTIKSTIDKGTIAVIEIPKGGG